MDKRDRIDTFGAVALTGFALLLAFNQVVIKVTNGGLQPVFFAGLRSAGAVLCVGVWLLWKGRSWRVPRDVLPWALGIGCVFAAEFLCLFIALDLSDVGRVGVIFYSMPVWLALMAHVTLPDDRVSGVKLLGLAICVGGVAWALLDRQGGRASWWGDLAALGAAIGWALTALLAKASPLRRVTPDVQLFWQVLVSAPLLIIVAPLFGDLVRDLAPIHLWGLAFQIVVVVTAGFIFWLWLLSIYPASGVASFSFLSPVMAVVLGWLLLDEPLSLGILGAVALVAVGIVLINRPEIVRFRKKSA